MFYNLTSFNLIRNADDSGLPSLFPPHPKGLHRLPRAGHTRAGMESSLCLECGHHLAGGSCLRSVLTHSVGMPLSRGLRLRPGQREAGKGAHAQPVALCSHKLPLLSLSSQISTLEDSTIASSCSSSSFMACIERNLLRLKAKVSVT